MPRYVVATKRDAKLARAPSALHEVEGAPGVKIVGSANPDVVTIETTAEMAQALRSRLARTHSVEAQIYRSTL